MRVVVDTNVWVSGLLLPDSVPGQVLRAVRDRRFEVIASWPLAEEIVRVLRSPKLRRYSISEADIADVLALIAPLLPRVEISAPLRDPSDVPVIATAVVGGADAIVTGDADLFEDDRLRAWLADRGIRVMTPRELLAI